MISIDREELKSALDKLCKVASSKPEAGPSHELKFKSKKEGVVIQAMNDIKTMHIRHTFSGSSCDCESEMEFCVPALPLAQAVSLLVGQKVTFTQSGRSILIGTDTGASDQEHSLMGMSPNNWTGRPVFYDERASFEVPRSILCSISRFESFACHTDSGMAPITAIFVRVREDGTLEATSTDQARMSFLDHPTACRNVKVAPLDDASTAAGQKKKMDTTGFFFMLPTNAAAVMDKLFGPECDWISVKGRDGRATFASGPLTFDIDNEKNTMNYPTIRERKVGEPVFSWIVDLSELRRIVNLVATIAMRTLCKVEFDPSGKLIVSGVGGVEKGSKSKQSIKPIEMDGDVPLDSNKIEVSCSDLVEALAVPTSDTVSIGLSSASAAAAGSILVIDQVKEPIWRHAMIRCMEAA